MPEPLVLVAPAQLAAQPILISNFIAQGQRFGEMGALLPVVGPGCAQIPSGGAVPITPIRDSLRKEAAAGDGAAMDVTTENDIRFLDRLWQVRGEQRNRLDSGEATDAEENTALRKLRLQLLKAARAATVAFATAVTESGWPIDDWREHAFEGQDIDAPSLHELTGHLRKAVDAAGRLSKGAPIAADSDWLDLLGAATFKTRLIHVADMIERQGRISGALVEWLTDLAWHAVVFASGVERTTEELAMQLSLTCGGETPVTRVDPPHAITTINPDQVAASMRSIFERTLSGHIESSDDQPWPRQVFYGSIAQYLFASFNRWQLAALKSSPPGTVPEWPIPLLFTTTFDLELEQALNDAGQYNQAFHVVIPVYEFANKHERHIGLAHLRWIVARVECCPGQPVRRKLDWEPVDAMAPNSGDPKLALAGLRLSGPLLVKLNGSPLHKPFPSSCWSHPGLEPTQKSALGRTVTPGQFPELHHAVVFSEFEHMQAGRDNTLTGWLAEAVRHQGRDWAFLGQRLEDWNTRMRLFFDIYYQSGAAEREDVLDLDPPMAIAINKKFDLERSSLLLWLDISRVEGDLADFVPHIQRLTAGL